MTSPYLRTQETASPTIERFPDVPVDTWPIQELTYLEPSRWNGIRSEERMPYIVRYWQEADTAFCDGEGAESFDSLLGGAQVALERLKSLSLKSPVYVFTIHSTSTHPTYHPSAKMPDERTQGSQVS